MCVLGVKTGKNPDFSLILGLLPKSRPRRSRFEAPECLWPTQRPPRPENRRRRASGGDVGPKVARFTTSEIWPDIVQVMIYLHDVAQGRWRGTGTWSSEGRSSTLSRTPAYLLNRNKAATVRFEDDVLTVWAKSGHIAQSVKAVEKWKVQLQKLPLISRLTVLTKQGQAITVSGLETQHPRKPPLQTPRKSGGDPQQ